MEREEFTEQIISKLKKTSMVFYTHYGHGPNLVRSLNFRKGIAICFYPDTFVIHTEDSVSARSYSEVETVTWSYMALSLTFHTEGTFTNILF